MGGNTIDDEGKIIMGDEANCDTNSHITDESHSQIKEEQGGKDQKETTTTKKKSLEQVCVDPVLYRQRYK